MMKRVLLSATMLLVFAGLAPSTASATTTAWRLEGAYTPDALEGDIWANGSEGQFGAPGLSTVDIVNGLATHPDGVPALDPASGIRSPSGATYDGAEVFALPEPVTWAMLVLGFGLLGLGALRRRAAMSAARDRRFFD